MGNTSIGKAELIEFCRKYNNNIILNPEPPSIYIPDIKLAVEYLDFKNHSEISGGKDRDYHKNLMMDCFKKKISTVQIFEDEWVDKTQIIKSMLVNKFQKIPNKLFARHCYAVALDPGIASKFTSENHISGGTVYGKSFGLIHKDYKLVSVMIFGKARFNSKHEYEIYRFSSKRGAVVIGGFSKIMKLALKELKPKSLVTFADARFGYGSVYKSNGFKYTGYSEPNYYYFHPSTGLKRSSRNSFQKHKLEKQLKIFDSKKTEWENMQLNNYDRIWDCGNFRFELI